MNVRAAARAGTRGMFRELCLKFFGMCDAGAVFPGGSFNEKNRMWNVDIFRFRMFCYFGGIFLFCLYEPCENLNFVHILLFITVGRRVITFCSQQT